MALNKQSLNVNFAQGLDTKTDPFQVSPGRFLSLQNSIFDKAGRLTKRNGFGPLTVLPDTSSTFLTTFNGNLTAVGTKLEAYNTGSNSWVDKGNLQPVSLNVLPLIRNNTNQTQADSALASNGLICTVYTDVTPSATIYRYAVADSVTGQNIVAPTTITTADATYGTPKVWVLGRYFIIVFTRLITATYHLQYIAININNPTSVTAPTDITAQYTPKTTLAWDGYVANNNLYLAWNGSGGAIRARYITQTLAQSAVVVFAGHVATHVSVTADISAGLPIIYISIYDSASGNGYTAVTDSNLLQITAFTLTIAAVTVTNITSVADAGIVALYHEVAVNYTYDAGIPTHYIKVVTMTQAGVVGTPAVVVRSVGLASKAFEINSMAYFLTIYQSAYQPTYFLINGLGQVVAKLAYSNAASYLVTGLPNVSISGNIASMPYLLKTLVESVNKTQGATVSAGVYAQIGVNLTSFTIGNVGISISEIGNNLNLSGGFLWAYDGFQPAEQEFFLWPDYVEVTTSTSGGSLTDQQYFYQVTYEWSDNQGNLFRSAPSIPVGQVTAGGNTSTNVVHVPTLRLTYKINNPVKIVVYRWSAAQQVYYQVTSISVPTLNNMAVDSVDFTDTFADSSIIGNNILYTTGGVLENIGPPATDHITLFNNRLWLVDSEDRNLLWYSKQVIEATPVEMSDLLTIYVAPTTSSEGSTGPITAIAPMDDKLIIFKQNAMGYINGIGPDNTGSNNGYSDFIQIASTVGCVNQNSIVFTPNGLMFQSNKGIWILGRDLSTNYIGAPVEQFNTATVLSAINIPATNQVRFTLDDGVTLMYDYYFGQWGTFTNVPALSSTIYQEMHTYVNSLGRIFQETVGAYLDNTSPVLMSFTTNWMNLAGVQGFERFYQMYLLGQYITPFKLSVQLAYDYNSSIQQSTIVTPITPGPAWGGDQLWGSNSLWGGDSSVFEARVFPQIQKCESFQVTINEIFDSTIGVAAGAGLTLTGLNLIVGMKKSYRTSSSSRSFG